MTETLANIIGSLATLCMLGGYLPQAVYTIRTRDTDGIAFSTFLLLGMGSLFFALQGALTSNIPLLVANTVTLAASVVITVIKIQNDRRKRRK